MNKTETEPLCSTEWYYVRQTSAPELGRGSTHEHRSKLVGFFKNRGLAGFATEVEKDQGACGGGGGGGGGGWGQSTMKEGAGCVMKASW